MASDGEEAVQQARTLILTFLLTFCVTAGCSTSTQERRGEAKNELSPCPKSPNCVSTRASDPDRVMPALPYVGTRQDSLDRLVQIMRDMKRCTVVTTADSYIHADFRSAVFGFVDDVEFITDDEERRIHFRSASRTGYYDFGVNRKRMEKISERYLEGQSRPSPKK